MAKEQTVLTKTASTGQKITVAIREVLRGQYRAVAYVNGKNFSTGNVMPLEHPQGNVTHFMQSGKKGVGFTAAEAATIDQAIALAEAEYAATPAGRMEALRQERQALVLAIDGADAQGKAEFNRLHARQDERCWQVRAEAETKLQTLLAGLNNWDKAHPEVLAQIKAEKDEQLQRFLAQD